MLSGAEPRKVARLLRGRAVLVDLVHAEVGMRAVGEAGRAGSARDLLHRNDMGEIAHAGAAIVRVRSDAEQAEFAEFRPEVARKTVRRVDLGRARRQALPRPAADGVAHRLDLL